MGTIYCGPYADAIGSDDHEGYAARARPDGTGTGVWTHETREFSGYRARCACGWHGAALHEPSDAGERSALDEWDQDHLRLLIDAAASSQRVPGGQHKVYAHGALVERHRDQP